MNKICFNSIPDVFGLNINVCSLDFTLCYVQMNLPRSSVLGKISCNKFNVSVPKVYILQPNQSHFTFISKRYTLNNVCTPKY